MATLQDCFDTTDWLMLREAGDGDINQYTDTVSSYTQHCIDDITDYIGTYCPTARRAECLQRSL